jgi:hypothetical protein
MEIIKAAKTKRRHHSVVVDEIPYYRNEDLEFDFEGGEWVRIKLSWVIGDKRGKGPFVEPKGSLDNIGNHTSRELEEMFLEKIIKKK